MRTLIKLPLIEGQEQWFECPHCGEHLRTGKRQTKCPHCKMSVLNPDGVLAQRRKQAAREEENRRLAAASKQHSSIAPGPGMVELDYIEHFRDPIIASCGIVKGADCPFCGNYISRGEEGAIELHHILSRGQFKALKMVRSNTFIGCNHPQCGDILDTAVTGRERVGLILEYGAQIIRCMPVPEAERPASPRILGANCEQAYRDYGVPYDGGAA